MSDISHEDFVSVEQAKLLKELGFDWNCFCYFLYSDELTIGEGFKDYNFIVGNDHISAPTLYQVQKWLREVKKINVEVNSCYNPNSDSFVYDCFIQSIDDDEIDDSTINHPTYESALSSGIDKTLKFIS